MRKTFGVAMIMSAKVLLSLELALFLPGLWHRFFRRLGTPYIDSVSSGDNGYRGHDKGLGAAGNLHYFPL